MTQGELRKTPEVGLRLKDFIRLGGVSKKEEWIFSGGLRIF